VVADLHHFGEVVQDLDPDPRQIEKSDRNPHRNEKRDSGSASKLCGSAARTILSLLRKVLFQICFFIQDSGEVERLTLKDGFAFMLFKEEKSVQLACRYITYGANNKLGTVILFCSVPDPVSGAFLTPGSGIRDEHRGSYFRDLRNNFLG
jgi:hypothetical protein